jgi:hypothetical protein
LTIVEFSYAFGCLCSTQCVQIGLPKNFSSRDSKVLTELPCIVRLLCEKYEGLQMEAKEIKEHWFKPYIRKLFDKKVGSYCH